jgi:hypothetical protein
MATPPGNPNTKTVRVGFDTHQALHDLAHQINGTADDAIRHLLGLSTVRVPVSEIQRQRWIAAARDAGVSVHEFVKMRVEAAIQFGADPTGLQTVYEHVRGIARALNLRQVPSTQSTGSSQQ